MKKNLIGILGCLSVLSATFAQKFEQRYAKPQTGTWLNLVYQDVRNKYTNPVGSDYTNPDMWEAKVGELAQMGVDYLVIMAVAYEQKSFYPSDFMPPAYDQAKKSPVEAIMDAADKHGINVFMSSGWAKTPYDDQRLPEIKAIQRKIMLETAKLYKDRPSFCGWYLPVEDSVEPILSDHAVDAVNQLVVDARAITPGKKVMISPYGFCFAKVATPEFRDQIRKLKVDIIAYQDEVGCVREALPMRRMKENFEEARKIHEGTNIEMWANNESFTWETEQTNSLQSALIPAAFPRYLSQMVGTTQAGAVRNISFIVSTLIDSPISAFPLGQPEYSQRMYRDYMDWKEGRGRWGLLEATFAGKVGRKVAPVSVAIAGKKIESLSDNKFGHEDPADGQWSSLESGGEILINMGKIVPVEMVGVRFLRYAPKGIAFPDYVEVLISKDGKLYSSLGVAKMEQWPNDLHDCWIDIAQITSDSKRSAQYIKVRTSQLKSGIMMVDEVLINPLPIKK